ncbi:MAG TPA: glycosyltransferase family 39 protein [Blastococcus sp.]|nr:glycosyltransferase family 39 protein [Blastococcus sp.]
MTSVVAEERESRQSAVATANPSGRDRAGLVALLAVLCVSAFIDFYKLSENRWANAFYSAAAQAGSQNWRAWFFGGSDLHAAISVDKIPAALWIDGLSVRLFGLNPIAILAPQALMGIASVWILFAAVRRAGGLAAAVVAGLALAVSPVAAEMFRFNNPDALLTLLMTASIYALLRAIDHGPAMWLYLVGLLTGLAFLAKMLQGVLLVPVLALVYLAVSPRLLFRRIQLLVGAGVAALLAAGWYIVAVGLTPPSDRPFVSSTLDNSVLSLTFGYNGFGRLTGQEIPAWLAGSAVTGRVGNDVGPWRLFGPEIGGQISWLLPAAAIAMVIGLVTTARRPRWDVERASYLAWGGWILVVGATFSMMRGVIHAYYTIALAPPIAALIGLSLSAVWRHRDRLLVVVLGAAEILAGAVWSFVLLHRTASFHPWLKYVVVVLAGAAIGCVALSLVWRRAPRVLGVVASIAAVSALLAGPASYTAYTIKQPTLGSIVVAGPVVDGGFDRRALVRPRPGRGYYGPTEAASVSPALRDRLRASTADWPVATIGAVPAAQFQLGTGRAALGIGGYNGLDPYPTRDQFTAMVGRKQIAYLFVYPGQTSVATLSPRSQAYGIYHWASAHCPVIAIDTTRFFDLGRCH